MQKLKNRNLLFIYFPFAFVPFWAIGMLADGIFNADAVALYFGAPLVISVLMAAAAYALRDTPRVRKFLDSCALNVFALLTFGTFVGSMLASSVLMIVWEGVKVMPYVLAAWLIMVTIFPLYLFPYLFAVYLAFYKNNPDYA